jgi:SAM-dependent methyltransferase
MDEYRDRRERAMYLLARYGRYAEGRILDVGCDEGCLRAEFPGRYVGIDRAGQPDLIVDLEGRLPFQDEEFDTVICTDVLEHVEEAHRLMAELGRVCRGRIILSLPNCWAALWGALLRGAGELKQYGLPVDPPPDRHRWFFNYEQAETFIRGQADRLGFAVRVCEPYYGRDGLIKRAAGLLYAFDQRRRRNLFARALWVVLERPAEAAPHGT